MNHSTFKTLAACALGTLIGASSASMGEVMLSDWTDDEHFYYYLKNMPDFDQKRCEDQEPSIKGLGNDGRNHCVPTATTNVFSYIASHGFPHIDPGVVWNPESDYHYNYFGEFIDDLGDDMDTDPWSGTNYEDYYNEIRNRLSCEFVVKLYVANESYSPNFKGLARSAINGHLVLVRYGYYDDNGTTSSGRYKVDRTGGHLTTFVQGWGWEGTEILTVRDPATGGDDCYTQSDFSSRSWHCEERSIRDEYGDDRVQCYMWEPGSDDNDYGDSRRYLDGYISIIPNRYYSWGPYDNGLRIVMLDHSLFGHAAGPVSASSYFDGWSIVEFHPRPTGLGGWAMMKSPEGATKMAEINLDTNTLEPMGLDNIADSPMRSTADQLDRLWIVDGAPGQQTRLQVVDFPSDTGDLGFRALASRDLQNPPAAMAASKDGLCAFFPMERVIRWYVADQSSGIESVRTASLPQEIDFQGECKMDVDPKTGNIAFWSEGLKSKLWSLRLIDEGGFAVETICGEHGGELDSITSFQFDDQGNMMLMGDGAIRFLRRNEQGQWTAMPDHPLAGIGQQDDSTNFRMLRSSTNLPADLPADQYDNAGLDYESSDTALEQVDCNTDINLDRKVDVNDLLIVIGEWGREQSPADVARDGVVDVLDLLAIFETWGSCE
ncbi:MAG: hypothetical protein MK085_13130 [Phycisphaerales bacterium]|nr:hypothetical protein [Phycisphaerales bacterium]